MGKLIIGKGIFCNKSYVWRKSVACKSLTIVGIRVNSGIAIRGVFALFWFSGKF